MNGIWNKVAELGAGCGVVAAAWTIIAIIIGFPIKWLWNWIMPNIFGLPEISFWMALGIALLISILFGGVIKVNNKK
mgnify:CR=1 FL=1